MGALGVYEWMRAPHSAGGAGLRPTAFTYAAVVRAAVSGNLLGRAMQVKHEKACVGMLLHNGEMPLFMQVLLVVFVAVRAGVARGTCSYT